MTHYLYNFPEVFSRLNIFIYVLTVFVGLFFILVSIKSFKADQQMVSDFKRWNYSEKFRNTVAVWQLLSGLLIIIIPVSYIFAFLLIILMLGAIYTHVKHDPPLSAAGAVVFLFMLSYIFWQLKPAILLNN